MIQEGTGREEAVEQLCDKLAEARTRLQEAEARITELSGALQVYRIFYLYNYK